MDNENTVQTEQEDWEETSFDLEAAFREGFGDDGPADRSGDAEETAEESEGTEADADQQEAEGTDGGDGTGGESAGPQDGETQETEAAGEAGETDQSDGFVLKHLGEEKTVSRDEVVSLAQKGMDYDRIREKWDAVKDDIPKLRTYESFLKELAEARGGDVDSLIDETRTRALIAQAEARGETLSPAAAAAQAVRMRTQGAPEKGGAEEADDGAGSGNRKMIDEFLEVFGKDVQAKDIPQEVWDEGARTGDMIRPYQRYLNNKLQEENKKLQQELKAAKQQQKNAARSAGSSRSEGSGSASDPFMEGWSDAW
jgi:hypothetical protein